MNDKSEIIEKIKCYIVKSSFSQSEDVQNNTLIFENSLLDSMGFLFLIDFLKEEFLIEVEDSELVDDNFKSINNIVEFVLKKLEKKKLKAEPIN